MVPSFSALVLEQFAHFSVNVCIAFSSSCRFVRRCLDANGENVYLPWDLRPCKFSAIAKEDNISGVHTAEKLLKSKRLPLMARLACGSPPLGLKSSGHFAPELRLFTSVDEEYIVAMNLGSNKVSVIHNHFVRLRNSELSKLIAEP